jgi:opacity protein-like surface antigen
MMKLISLPTLAAALAFWPCAIPAGEVPLNALSADDENPEMATTVYVERDQGPYISLWLGAASGGDATFSGRLKGAELDSNTDFAFGAKFGYFYRTPFFVRPSIELELGYLDSEIGASGNAGNVRSFRGSGDFQSIYGTVNVVLALDLAPYRDTVGDILSAIHPYIGAGIGGAYSRFDGMNGKGRTDDGSRKVRVDGGSKFDFAHQIFGGIEIDLDDEFSIFGEYKRITIESTGSDSIRNYERNLWIVGAKIGY